MEAAYNEPEIIATAEAVRTYINLVETFRWNVFCPKRCVHCYSTNLEESDGTQDAEFENIGFTAIPEQPYAELVWLSKHVAYFRRHDAAPLTTYAGFSAKARGEAWGRWLVSFSIADGFELRSGTDPLRGAPKHLTDHKHELKLWGLNLAQVLALNDIKFG